MFFKRYITLIGDPVWAKVLTFSVAFFFIMLADAVISFWAPNLIEESLGSAVLMGVIIGFQSMVGFVADLVFPTLLARATVKRLVLLAIVTSLATMLFLFGAALKPLIIVFLMAMALWGLYYEFEMFATHQFMADTVPLMARSGAWGVMGVFKNLAYFLGPLVAAWLLIQGNWLVAIFILILLWAGFVAITSSGRIHARPLTFDIAAINLWQEVAHWLTLAQHVWPVIIMSLLLAAIDAVFWTTGAVWTKELVRQNPLGGFFLPLYALPSLFVGLVVARLGIYRGKKKLAEIFLVAAGLFLAGLGLLDSVLWQLALVLISSLMLAVTYPLVGAVYSDIVARLGKQKRHLIGFSSSIVNVAYIITPPLAGIITSEFGEKNTFAAVGIVTAAIAFILIFVTPKKLKLPQTEIHEWQE